MFCGKCGIENSDDAVVCTGCGAKLHSEQASKSSTYVAINSNDKYRKVGMIAVVVAAVIVIALMGSLYRGRSCEATAKKFLNALSEGDAGAIVELIPKKLREDADFGEFRSDYAKSITFSYKNLTFEDVSGDDLDGIKDDYMDFDIKVSAAKTARMKLTITLFGMTESKSAEIPLIKVGSSWYLDVENMDDIF